MIILCITPWINDDPEEYGVCSWCHKELYCCSCDGGI